MKTTHAWETPDVASVETDDATHELWPEVDVLLFHIGANVYGTDASQVLRIDRANVDAIQDPALGQLEDGRRALVFEDGEGYEAQLRVDTVIGIRVASGDRLRRMPAPARQTPFTLGIWLGHERPVVLLDLLALATAHAPPVPESAHP